MKLKSCKMNRKFKINSILILVLCFFLCGCSNRIDNYLRPDASIFGAILDIKTNDTVPTANNTQAFGTGYPDGDLNIYQQDYSSTASGPQGTSYGQDGTYNNLSIYEGTYKGIPVGAFYSDTVLFTVKGRTRQDFRVSPFLHVTIQILSVTNSSISIKYEVRSNDSLQSVSEAAAWLSPSAGVNRFSWLGSNFNPVDASSYRDDHSDLSQDASFTRTFSKLKANSTYYIRAGGVALGNNPQSYWNYSKVLKVQTDIN